MKIPFRLDAGKPVFVVAMGLTVIAAAALSPLRAAQATDALDNYHMALAHVERALAAHGGPGPIEAAGGIVIETEGTFDLATRLQGRSAFSPEPTPIRERISIDLAGGWLAYELDWRNYKFSRQNLMELYDNENHVAFIDKRSGGGWMPFPPLPDAKKRYKRFLPTLFLQDAYENRQTLSFLGENELAGALVYAVRYTSAGEPLTLYINRETGLLAGAASIIDMELLGDTELRWAWSDYAPVAGVTAPGRFTVHMNNELMKDVRMSVSLGIPAENLDPPAGIDIGEPPEEFAFTNFTPYSERPGQAREIEPGVYLAPNVRAGFHMFFVEFEDFVMAVDAPTGWFEMNQVPPSNFGQGASDSALSEKYIRIIRDTVPDKPIRYVVLTHHHSDHIGGVRAFIDEGATVLAGDSAAAYARRSAERPHTLGPDDLAGSDVSPDIEIVDGERVISDGTMEVRLISLPDGNPKADDFLVVHLPNQDIMYFTSFIYPVPEAAFPVIESVPLSLWFVRWYDQSGIDAERIYNVHGAARVQDWQLERLREMLDSGEYEVAGEVE